MSLNGNSRTADKFVIRLPDGMRERIALIADKNHRSMNSEIIGRLEDSINADDPSYTPEHPDQLSGEEMAIVMAARAMTKGKRKALLTLMANDK